MKASFKLNQVQEAIALTIDRRVVLRNEQKVRLKRLLLTDRRLGRPPKSRRFGGQHYAFYSDEAPGSGIEVMFTSYEVFAQLTALKLLEHGLPPIRVVEVMTEIRGQLAEAHAQILAKDSSALLDDDTIKAQAKPRSTDEIFLVTATFPPSSQRDKNGGSAVRICRGQAECMDFLLRQSPAGTAATLFPLARLMISLAENLSQVRPVKRGQPTITHS
jgi:hypothetical protein